MDLHSGRSQWGGVGQEEITSGEDDDHECDGEGEAEDEQPDEAREDREAHRDDIQRQRSRGLVGEHVLQLELLLELADREGLLAARVGGVARVEAAEGPRAEGVGDEVRRVHDPGRLQ